MNKLDTIETVEEFIKHNKPSDNSIHENCISYRDIDNGKKIYNKLKDLSGNDYEIFGSNGMGYTSFALYKSKKNIIYMISIRIQTIVNYYLINENSFNC
jgi:hypothetical protein